MSSEFFPVESLKSLIGHHIALIGRYDAQSDQEFSLLYFEFGKYKDNIEVKRTIQTVFRDCDIIFEYNGDNIILLPKANWQYSFSLLKDLKEFLNQDVEDSIVTYPDDGKDALSILKSLQSIVKKNHNIDLQL
jgi:hypothetical protein